MQGGTYKEPTVDIVELRRKFYASRLYLDGVDGKIAEVGQQFSTTDVGRQVLAAFVDINIYENPELVPDAD